MVALTIGMATYKDFDGCYFTIQALRHYHDLSDTELVVVDNFGDQTTKEFVEGWAKGRYILATDAVGTAAPRDRVFREARGDAVLCCDSHVLFAPGAIARLKQYYRDHPNTRDLLQGPLIYDDLQNLSTHFQPEWRGQMWGTWGTDERGKDPEGEPFDIPMQGLGSFSCLRAAWPGFNPRFRGFGGEEGYIHEKFRQRGGRTLCLPWFRWNHRFARPAGVPYPLYVEDKFRNYVIGHTELGLDIAPAIEHFRESLPQSTIDTIVAEIRGASGGPMITSGFTPLNDDSVAARGADAAAPAAPPSDTAQVIAPAPAAAAMRPPRVEVVPSGDRGHYRAVTLFVEDNKHIVQQALAVRESWLYIEAEDTDLVVMGPGEVLAHLPDDLVKIEQRPVVEDPVWRGYRYVNSIACMNGAGAEQLNRYSHILRTDVDTFLTPAWNAFYPETFCFGHGGYVNDDITRQHLRQIATDYGLNHRGYENLHSTWYGRTDVMRRACAFSEMLTKHLLTHYFLDDEGEWPGWYRGVCTMYSGELAVNHCVEDGTFTDQLDASNTSTESTARYAHIHCWHTDSKFSKHAFMGGNYGPDDYADLDVGIMRDFCMEMSRRSVEAISPLKLPDAALSAV